MDFTPGTGATIQATTLENQCYSIARSIQNFERNEGFNPGNEIDMITSSSDDDTQIFSGSCSIYTRHTLGDAGNSNFSIPNPYSSLPLWDEGTDGQGTANSWTAALVERFLALALFERNEIYNVSNVTPKITNIQWSMLDSFPTLPVLHNCILSFDFSFDYNVISSNNGTITEAKSYLSGSYS
ncbi:MAG: hypothetical protein WBA93_20145, partial [Microcoleaceae cyanobacterium]